ncbi:YfhD family protein [Paenibacillus nanensis]|uniref:YfhD family protein n=1 Tax=Paenibacillus nanensis TaxID=393251 RepID=A0A3A1V9K6_9BACL|nr:YfhD family protein [Paenibacillus nanensis]RIX54110.1 YfhD family protein [Paenibacillus nanensis]
MNENYNNNLNPDNAGLLPEDMDGKVEDVEFSEELADEADRIAQRRAREADARNEERS